MYQWYSVPTGAARAHGRLAVPALRHRVRELPPVGRDLLLVPLARFVVPLVPPADLHAGVAAPLERLVGVIRVLAHDPRMRKPEAGAGSARGGRFVLEKPPLHADPRPEAADRAARREHAVAG